MNHRAVRRRRQRLRFEQKKQARLKKRASKRNVVIERFGHGQPFRKLGRGPNAPKARKAGGPKSVTIRAHR